MVEQDEMTLFDKIHEVAEYHRNAVAQLDFQKEQYPVRPEKPEDFYSQEEIDLYLNSMSTYKLSESIAAVRKMQLEKEVGRLELKLINLIHITDVWHKFINFSVKRNSTTIENYGKNLIEYKENDEDIS